MEKLKAKWDELSPKAKTGIKIAIIIIVIGSMFSDSVHEFASFD